VEPLTRSAARARFADYPYLSVSRRYLSDRQPYSESAFEAGLDLICAGAEALLLRRPARAGAESLPAVR
jgi:hypothetical protein